VVAVAIKDREFLDLAFAAILGVYESPIGWHRCWTCPFRMGTASQHGKQALYELANEALRYVLLQARSRSREAFLGVVAC